MDVAQPDVIVFAVKPQQVRPIEANSNSRPPFPGQNDNQSGRNDNFAPAPVPVDDSEPKNNSTDKNERSEVAFLGATFQMLLAGIEAGALDLRPFERGNLYLFLGGGVLPALMGAGLALAVGLGWTGALLTASVFVSSSILLR